MSKRVVIVGGPKTGKTTLGEHLRRRLGRGHGIPVRHTDDLIGSASWSEASSVVADWFDEPGDWVIEGVTTARALRKWLLRGSEGKPCDGVIVLEEFRADVTDRQAAMARSVMTVFNEVEIELLDRGVEITFE